MDRRHASLGADQLAGRLSRRATLRGLAAGLAVAALRPAAPATRLAAA